MVTLRCSVCGSDKVMREGQVIRCAECDYEGDLQESAQYTADTECGLDCSCCTEEKVWAR